MLNEKILIFGVGVAGRAIYRKLNPTHNIVGFIDNNKDLDGTKYHNKNIYSLDKIQTIDFDKVAVSGVWINSMEKQLKDLGINSDRVMLIPDNTIDFSSQNRVETTDQIMKHVSNICSSANMLYYIIGSSLATLFRNKDLSCVADVDLFLTSQKDANIFYDLVSKNDNFKNYSITKVIYETDEILVKQGDIKKIVISSIIDKSEEEASIVDVGVADLLGDKYMVRHDKNYIYVPKQMCDGVRYYNYKDFKLQIPYLAEDYLSLLYGKNWIIPPKKWDQSDYGNLLTPQEVLKLKGDLNG